MRWYIDSCVRLDNKFNDYAEHYKDAHWLVNLLINKTRFVYLQLENNTQIVLVDKKEKRPAKRPTSSKRKTKRP